MKYTTHQSQRGVAALIVTLLLFLALALTAFGLHRHLILEQRSAANHVRATQAFEAAEAGLEWAQAQLNSTQRIGADCKPSTDPNARTFRARYLTLDRVTGLVSPTPAQPGCARTASGWACSCPAGGAAAPSVPTGTQIAPTFTLTFQPGARPGAVRIAANGCTRLAGACAPNSATTADATARTEVTLGLFAGLRTPPTAAITTRDVVGQTSDQFFATWFGIDKATWRNQSVVARIACTADCGRVVLDALDAGSTLIWVDGDLALAGEAAVGTAARPIVIVATGQIRLAAGAAVTGAIYGASITLVGDDATVHGAILSEGSYAGPALSGARWDADTLAALTHQTGSFARVSGSWRDFF